MTRCNRVRGARRGRVMRPASSGFTLIELMIVILIIAILAAIILPAFQGVVARGREAQVVAEISQLEMVLEDFRRQYGVYPPSYIHLHSGDIPDPNGTRHQQLAYRTVLALERIWPNFNAQAWADQVGNIEWDLNGAECLVFFLGGVPDTSTGVPATIGFSTSPTNPFAPSTSRTDPLFDFLPNRLSDVDDDGFWEYYDPRTEAWPIGGAPFDGTGITFNAAVNPGPYLYFSTTPFEEMYFADNPLPGGNFGLPFATSVNLNVNPPQVDWIEDRGYQIMSPGTDGLIGTGPIPFPAIFNTGIPDSNTNTVGTDGLIVSIEAEDNITSFSAGQLRNQF